eukprot:scaffold133333_cov19-Tisochrysis_lutea.AAC.1
MNRPALPQREAPLFDLVVVANTSQEESGAELIGLKLWAQWRLLQRELPLFDAVASKSHSPPPSLIPHLPGAAGAAQWRPAPPWKPQQPPPAAAAAPEDGFLACQSWHNLLGMPRGLLVLTHAISDGSMACQSAAFLACLVNSLVLTAGFLQRERPRMPCDALMLS